MAWPGLIADQKGLQNTYQPLLVAAIIFKDSQISPTTLLVSSHDLTLADGTQPTGIANFPYNGQDFTGRLSNQEIAATQALSDNGIDVTPTVTLEFADADKTIWGKERDIGFKGARMYLYYIFWEVGTAHFSTDYRPIFTGICGPGKARETTLTVQAVSKMNMNQTYLPPTRIMKRCPWIFPDTTGMTLVEATAAHQSAADDSSKDSWHCGYSYLASGSNAVGNPVPGTSSHYQSCTFDNDACLDRLGNRALVYSSGAIAPIEKDLAGHSTARFGGVQWDQPSQFRSRGYGQTKSEVGYNSLNEGKYNDYVPMGWGTYWIDPVVLNIVGDSNFTRMEVLVGMGEVAGIQHVICNDIDVDKLAGDPPTQNAQIAIQLWWNDLTTGDRNGKVNGTSIYNGQGDPYGSMKVLVVNVPHQLTPSSSVPRIRVLLQGPKIRKYVAVDNIVVSGVGSTPVAAVTMVGPNTDINNTTVITVAGNTKSDANGIFTVFTGAFGPPGTFSFNIPSAISNGTGTGGTASYEYYTSNPAWILMDMLVWSGWNYSDIDILTFINAAAFYDVQIPYNNVSGYVNVLNDGITVQQVSGNDYSDLTVGATVYINGVAKVVATVDSSTQFTITVAFAHLGIGHPNALTDVTYLASGPSTHARFELGLGISQRITASDLIRQVRTTCRSTIVPAGDTGLFQLFPDMTLTDQQPSAVTGSNFNTAIASIHADGTNGNGYVAWKFDLSSILPDGSGNSTLIIDQPDPKDSPNRVSFPFYDKDNGYAQDSLTLVDSADVVLMEHPIDGNMPSIGNTSFDQAKRVASTWMAKITRGNTKANSTGTYNISFQTSFKCLHLRIGHIVLLQYDQYAIEQGLSDSAGGDISGFLARVKAIKPSANFQSVQLTLEYHDDNWYVDSQEQNGFQRQSQQFRNALARPSYPWSPFYQQPLASDALYNRTNWQMGSYQEYDISMSHQPLPTVHVIGNLPINMFSDIQPPTIGAQGTTAGTGGTVRAGRTYYGRICGYDSDGNITVPSNPAQPCTINVPAGANTATLTFPITNWPVGTVSYELFVGTLLNKLTRQKSGSVIGPGNPATITLTSYSENTWGIPDVEFNSLSYRLKRCIHAGIAGAPIVAVTSTTIKVQLSGGNVMATNLFAPVSGNPYYIMLIGLKGDSNPLPIANWAIVSNTSDTFTVSGIDPTGIDRGDGTNGLHAGDVVILTMRPDVINSNTIRETNWINVFNPFLGEHPVTNATNATPIVVTLSEDPGTITGGKVFIDGVGGCTNANGLFYVTRLTGNNFQLYTDAARTVGAIGNGVYTSGGTFNEQDQGLATSAENGNELYCIFGTGAGTVYKIKSNNQIDISVEGEWLVTPDATSVFIVNVANWELNSDTDAISSATNGTTIDIALNVPNYSNQLMFQQVFTLDGGGNESFRAASPWRMLWLFGQNVDDSYITSLTSGQVAYA